jgi:uncharacterized protein
MTTTATWVEAREFSLRSAGNNITGYPAMFDSLSEDLGGFVEVIRPGAFDPVMRDDVRATIDHEGGVTLLGRTRSGTLKISVDRRGLLMDCKVPATTAGQDVRILMERGDLSQGSFAFDIGVDRWSYQSGVLLREILSFSRLYDVSVVTYPAYPATEVGLRNTQRGTPSSSAAQAAARRRKLDLLLVS